MAIADSSNVIELRTHDPAWAGIAHQEAGRIAKVVGINLERVEHFGSTAIPGIRAKPTIDLLPVVRSLAALDEKAEAIGMLGYEWRGEFGIPGRRFCQFANVTGQCLFNVHFFADGCPEIDRLIAFRDYLRAHPLEARQYEAEKIRAAATYPNDVMDYNRAKDPWIKSCELRALAWWAVRPG